MAESNTKASKKPMGRPLGSSPLYSEELTYEICARIAEGEPLRQICRDKGYPSWRTVYDWLEAHDDFSARFARAREIGADAIAAEALEIADTPVEAIRRKLMADGKEEITYEDALGHRKLQIETRFKLLSKWFPKKYGEKVVQEHTGPDGAPLHLWGGNG